MRAILAGVANGELRERGAHDFEAFLLLPAFKQNEAELVAALGLVLHRVTFRRAGGRVRARAGTGVGLGRRGDLLQREGLRFLERGVEAILAVNGVEALETHQLLGREHEVTEDVLVLWVVLVEPVVPKAIRELRGDNLFVNALVRFPFQTGREHRVDVPHVAAEDSCRHGHRRRLVDNRRLAHRQLRLARLYVDGRGPPTAFVPCVAVEHRRNVAEIVGAPAFFVQNVGDARRIGPERRRAAADDRRAAGLVLFLDGQHAEFRRAHVLQHLVRQTQRGLAVARFAGELKHQVEGQRTVSLGSFALHRADRSVGAEQRVQVASQGVAQLCFERWQRLRNDGIGVCFLGRIRAAEVERGAQQQTDEKLNAEFQGGGNHS